MAAWTKPGWGASVPSPSQSSSRMRMRSRSSINWAQECAGASSILEKAGPAAVTGEKRERPVWVKADAPRADCMTVLMVSSPNASWLLRTLPGEKPPKQPGVPGRGPTEAYRPHLCLAGHEQSSARGGYPDCPPPLDLEQLRCATGRASVGSRNSTQPPGVQVRFPGHRSKKVGRTGPAG